jgi:hypothetical protein
MKKTLYILPLLILLWSCANRTSYLQKENNNQFPDTIVNERYEKRIVKQKNDTGENPAAENDKDNVEFTGKDLNDISYQKLKQFFEMMNLTGKNRKKDLQEYTRHQAEKFWVDSVKSESIWQNKNLQNTDSIVISSLKPIDFQENNKTTITGTYLLTLKTYKNGKENDLLFHAKIIFEIIDLALNEKIYKTIKTKIISIDQ